MGQGGGGSHHYAKFEGLVNNLQERANFDVSDGNLEACTSPPFNSIHVKLSAYNLDNVLTITQGLNFFGKALTRKSELRFYLSHVKWIWRGRDKHNLYSCEV